MARGTYSAFIAADVEASSAALGGLVLPDEFEASG